MRYNRRIVAALRACGWGEHFGEGRSWSSGEGTVRRKVNISQPKGRKKKRKIGSWSVFPCSTTKLKPFITEKDFSEQASALACFGWGGGPVCSIMLFWPRGHIKLCHNERRHISQEAGGEEGGGSWRRDGFQTAYFKRLLLPPSPSLVVVGPFEFVPSPQVTVLTRLPPLCCVAAPPLSHCGYT